MNIDLHSFKDIHAHSISGSDVITSVYPDFVLSAEQGSAWYSIGIHPWNTTEPVSDATWTQLKEKAADSRVLAIGEAGLDAIRGGDTTYQEEVFIRQIKLAEELGKPLIIHCVRRFGKLLELRNKFNKGQWIVHGFRGKPELARQLVAAGIAISLGPETPRENYLNVPDSMIYYETDC